MRKGILRRLGRRGATATAVVAMAAGGVVLATGSASADGWYYLNSHPTSHGVGVYASPYSWSGKTAGDLWSFSWSGDSIYYTCWTRGENINNQGNVWYQVAAVDSASYGYASGTAYVYGAYTDGNWLFHSGQIRPC
ncbi:hypothetical protein F7Q99_32265 [Streptomyces kaniharaensis]|uniref:Uncharacterized protein n=1 Tax=Streptomyces kaniharaensis TaxID=212423 RepID=A0A6N7KYW8_9ACTN|nr:hypothetical protein [Streptomyces kaniharaensis]MQS16740.1 hypothetical protein [Streptomyces kaniharaensis]